MRTPQKLGLAAAVVFVISHVLPAYGDGSGFACFGVAWSFLWGGEEVFTGAWFYYSGLVICNILFAVLVVALLMTRKQRKLRAIGSVVLFLHVLSWLLLHIFGESSELLQIKIGYYAWLIAYGLLVAAHLWKEPGQAVESIPPADRLGSHAGL